MRVHLKVKPKASRISLALISADSATLEITVTQQPVRGAATKAAVLALAEAMGVAQSRIRLVSGQSSRYKVVEILPEDQPKLEQLLRTLSN